MSKRENSNKATGSPSPLAGEGARDAKHRGRVRGSSLSKDKTPHPAHASGVRHPKSELRSSRLPQGERVAPQAQGKVCVGRIGAAHGVRGQVKLWTFTEDPLSVTRYGPLTTKDGARQFEVTQARQARGYLVATLNGIATRNEAERLKGVELYVAREKLPAIAGDEYYHADLIGLAAVTTTGEPLGRVVAIHNFGAGDIIEIAPPDGATMLLPFSNAVVPTIDIAGGRVVIEVPQEIEADDAPRGV